MTSPRGLKDTVERGLCTGCGLCESIGGDRLPMRLNTEGYLRPDVPDDLDATTEHTIMKVCPGVNQTGPTAPRRDTVWGPYKELHLGHAVNETLRFEASSGGVTSAAAIFLLDHSLADVVLHIATDPQNPMRSLTAVSRNAADIRERVGARYGPGGPLTRLHELLDRGERIAIIGKPCDIAAVRNLARRDPRVDKQVVALLSFFCAGLPGLAVSKNIVAKYGLAERDVAQLRYRGHGCPGPTRIAARDGRVFEQTYQETWSSDLTQGIQFRCKICPDSTGEQADIVCGDAWEGGEGETGNDDRGHNIVIVRTRRGQELLHAMEKAAAVALVPLKACSLEVMQPHQARRKRQLLARLIGLKLAGQPAPRYRRLGLVGAALSGWPAFRTGIKGMMMRVKRGDNREHLPAPSGPAAKTMEYPDP